MVTPSKKEKPLERNEDTFEVRVAMHECHEIGAGKWKPTPFFEAPTGFTRAMSEIMAYYMSASRISPHIAQFRQSKSGLRLYNFFRAI